MRDDLQAAAPSAYAYPLLIKQLLHTPLAQAPDQEIVYRGADAHDLPRAARAHRAPRQRPERSSARSTAAPSR